MAKENISNTFSGLADKRWGRVYMFSEKSVTLLRKNKPFKLKISW
jgi:hypothetical protein